MINKIGITAWGCLFAFILITTAWDYCRPDADKLLSVRGSMISGSRMEKEHYPCASLKDAYDLFPAILVSRESSAFSIQPLASVHRPLSFKEHPAEFHGLSPPVPVGYLTEFPICLRYGNLRF